MNNDFVDEDIEDQNYEDQPLVKATMSLFPESPDSPKVPILRKSLFPESPDSPIFDNSKTEMLIKEVKQCPCLWDKGSHEYKNGKLREVEWIGISRSLESTACQFELRLLYLSSYYCCKLMFGTSGPVA
uniref:MADF domain-containing protein n=1 Tax=Romanomermis culicivorax TaxID=13658 RepID=A0A915J297_ROMCU